MSVDFDPLSGWAANRESARHAWSVEMRDACRDTCFSAKPHQDRRCHFGSTQLVACSIDLGRSKHVVVAPDPAIPAVIARWDFPAS